MTPEKLKELGEAGWIIGPNETEKNFVKRIDTQKAFAESNLESLRDNHRVMRYIKEKLYIEPSWIQVRYSNKGLKFWEGAASWISEKGNWIQLRKAFKKGSFLGHSQNEVIIHEMIHSIRFAFEEPRFEEIIAYIFTKKQWRRFFGPLFSTTRQAYIFFTTLLLIPIAPSISFAYFLWRLVSLIRNQYTFKKAFRKIQELFPYLSPYSVVIRLTDEEIQFFSKQDIEKIKDYIQSQQKNLRWKQLSFLTTRF